METLYLDPTLCYRNPNQPREHFGQAELQELADSIKKNGQYQAGRVRPDADGRYMIIMGERRWRACQLAGVPYKAEIVADIDDETLLDQAFEENYKRVDVSPIEEARFFQRRLQTLAVEELAKRMGLRQSFVESRVKLLGLRDLYQTALMQGGLTIGQANQLARLSLSGQDHLVKLIDSGKVKSYKQVCDAADAILQAEQQTHLFAPPAPPSKDEKKVINKIQSQVTAILKLIGNGFKDGEAIIVKKIEAHYAKELVAKIDLMQKHLQWLKSNLEQAVTKQYVAETIH